jgi:hypothetical protein
VGFELKAVGEQGLQHASEFIASGRSAFRGDGGDVVKGIILLVVLYAVHGRHLIVSEVICLHDEGAQAISLEADARARRREVHGAIQRALLRVNAGDLKG